MGLGLIKFELKVNWQYLPCLICADTVFLPYLKRKNLEIRPPATGCSQCLFLKIGQYFCMDQKHRLQPKNKQLERSLDGCYIRVLRTALNINWRDKVTNKNVYRDLLKVTRKVREHRLSTAGHFHHHQEEAARTLVLWDQGMDHHGHATNLCAGSL